MGSEMCIRDSIWGLPYKIIRERIGQERARLSSDVIQTAVRSIFPNGTPFPRDAEQVPLEDIPPVTTEEVKAAAERIALREAPGPDGVPAEATRMLMARWPAIFAEMVNSILKQGIFPQQWKTANLSHRHDR